MNLRKIVDADNLKETFVGRVCNMYNVEMFFIEDVLPNKSKYTSDTQLRDMQLRIFLGENNIIVKEKFKLSPLEHKQYEKIK